MQSYAVANDVILLYHEYAQAADDDDDMKSLISATETAKRLAVSIATLNRWRKDRKGPPAYRIGQHWKYDESEIADYIQSCRLEAEKFQEILNRPSGQ